LAALSIGENLNIQNTKFSDFHIGENLASCFWLFCLANVDVLGDTKSEIQKSGILKI
jgi:hypothetical protein